MMLKQELPTQCNENLPTPNRGALCLKHALDSQKLNNHLCLCDADFPSQSVNEVEPEFRTSRAAVIASEPIPENLEITRTRVKKTARLVISVVNERKLHLRVYFCVISIRTV